MHSRTTQKHFVIWHPYEQDDIICLCIPKLSQIIVSQWQHNDERVQFFWKRACLVRVSPTVNISQCAPSTEEEQSTDVDSQQKNMF